VAVAVAVTVAVAVAVAVTVAVDRACDEKSCQLDKACLVSTIRPWSGIVSGLYLLSRGVD